MDKTLQPVPSRGLEPITNEPTEWCNKKCAKIPDMTQLKAENLRRLLTDSLMTCSGPTKRKALHYNPLPSQNPTLTS